MGATDPEGLEGNDRPLYEAVPGEATELESLGEDERALYEAVPADGTTISNPALRRALGWGADEHTDRYFAARDRVEDAGVIVRGRGRGGTVRRSPSDADAAAAAALGVAKSPEEVAAALRRELDLYEPLYRVIRGEWAKDHRASPLAVEITAQQGRRATGGPWSRPDIVTVEVRTFAYVPGKYIELITFEVKPSDAITVQAVYEALAHRRGDPLHVLLHVPSTSREELESSVADVAEVARAHGIGVVTVEDPEDYETWEEREVAQRSDPDPERLDVFIATQLSDETGQAISLALR